MPEIKVKGASIYYRQRGKGEPLLLVHGWNASSAMWTLNLRNLSAGHRVIAVDLPGHGGSGLPEGFVPDLAGYAGFLEDLRRALYLPGLDLVGHSMGGSISLLYALEHPERVSRMVLMDVPRSARPSTCWPGCSLPDPAPSSFTACAGGAPGHSCSSAPWPIR